MQAAGENILFGTLLGQPALIGYQGFLFNIPSLFPYITGFQFVNDSTSGRRCSRLQGVKTECFNMEEAGGTPQGSDSIHTENVPVWMAERFLSYSDAELGFYCGRSHSDIQSNDRTVALTLPNDGRRGSGSQR